MAWLDARASEKVQPESAETGRRPGELADPAAAAKRAAARAERVARGLDELDQWLCDQIRGGIAGLNKAGYAHFDTVAARMVDAQAPGLAGMLRSIRPSSRVPDGRAASSSNWALYTCSSKRIDGWTISWRPGRHGACPHWIFGEQVRGPGHAGPS